MKKEGIFYIGFILGAVLIGLVVYLGALRGKLELYEVILSGVALLMVAFSYYVYMRLPQFRELERKLQALAAENRKLRENNSVLKEQGLVAFLSVISILIGLRVISITPKDPVNFILSLTLLIVGVLLLIHFVGNMGGRMRQRRRSE